MPVKCVFKGQVSNEEIHEYFAAHRVDCFLSASSTEGLPVSIMEAMSYGIPIVATDVGGTYELVGDNGVLVKADTNGKEIADAVGKVISDPDAFKKMSECSRTLWKERFDSDVNAGEFVGVLENHSRSGFDTIIYAIDSLVSNRPFISAEIAHLAEKYKVILVDGPNGTSDIPKDILAKLDGYGIKPVRPCIRKSLFRRLTHTIGFFFDKNCREEINCIFASKKKIARRLYESSKYYSDALDYYNWFENEHLIGRNDRVLFYSFWHQYYTLSMIFNREKYPDLGIITREHGFDLYDERRTKSLRQPFREYMDKRIDAIVFACKTGKDYYVRRNSADPDDRKYVISYLGSKPPLLSAGHQKNPGEDDDNVIRLVSCSNMVAIKRIELIIDSLAYLDKQYPDKTIEWVHFGDGEERSRLEDMASRIMV